MKIKLRAVPQYKPSYPVTHKYTHADHHDVPYAKLHSGAEAFPASENPCSGGHSPGLSERHQRYCAPERCMGRAGSGLQCGVPESTPQQHRLSEDAVETAEGWMSCCTAEATGITGSWASCVCPHSGKLKSYVSIIELHALEILVTHSVVLVRCREKWLAWYRTSSPVWRR